MVVEVVYQGGVFRPVNPIVGIADGQAAWVALEQVGNRSSEKDERQRHAEVMAWLESAGHLDKPPAPTGPRPVDPGPLRIAGVPLSATILDDRE